MVGGGDGAVGYGTEMCAEMSAEIYRMCAEMCAEIYRMCAEIVAEIVAEI